MNKLVSLTTFFAIIALLLIADVAISCSMYKVTLNDKTIVGTNFDAYYLTPVIWFENKEKPDEYGAVFTGGRFDGVNGYAPQSGMNEFGLAFSRLAAPSSEKPLNANSNKIIISNPTNYLKEILHKCKNTEEVNNYINKYDHSYFSEDVFIYIEKSGKCLIVESDTMYFDNNAKYVLSNFCPSTTKESDALKLNRYSNGVKFLKNKIDTSLAFCTALSDTMHVCRNKIGDGTLLTSIWDLKDGITSHYFYHDYSRVVKFNLKDELAKGNHLLNITNLFPQNAEFEKLINYKIPQNSIAIMFFLLTCAGLFLFSSIFFLFSFLRNKNKIIYGKIKLALVPLGLIMLYYLYVLARNRYIFYFPAPYKDYKFSMLNIAAYIPFLLLLLIIPLLIVNFRLFKEQIWSFSSKWLFTLNNISYSVLLVLFFYWGLFNIFN
jgi:hypothetical protein